MTNSKSVNLTPALVKQGVYQGGRFYHNNMNLLVSINYTSSGVNLVSKYDPTATFSITANNSPLYINGKTYKTQDSLNLLESLKFYH